MQLKIYVVCDRGCVREHNEDTILIGNKIFRDGKMELAVNLNKNKKFFVAIADGLGGHNAGEVASEIVLRKMAETIEILEFNLSEKELFDKISEQAKETHAYILEEGNRDPNKKGMGSTLISLLLYNNKVYYLNVGDSRLYRFRNGNLRQISKDHSLSEVTSNLNIPSNIIINSFGGGEKIFIDFAPAGGKMFSDDIFLLCSDGLSDMLTDDEIEHILNTEKGNPVGKFLTEANNKGGKDNISIMLLNIHIPTAEQT